MTSSMAGTHPNYQEVRSSKLRSTKDQTYKKKTNLSCKFTKQVEPRGRLADMGKRIEGMEALELKKGDPKVGYNLLEG